MGGGPLWTVTYSKLPKSSHYPRIPGGHPARSEIARKHRPDRGRDDLHRKCLARPSEINIGDDVIIHIVYDYCTQNTHSPYTRTWVDFFGFLIFSVFWYSVNNIIMMSRRQYYFYYNITISALPSFHKTWNCIKWRWWQYCTIIYNIIIIWSTSSIDTLGCPTVVYNVI